MAMGCNLIIDKIELITKNKIKAEGYMNYAGNNNNRVVFEIDCTGEICRQISGYFFDKVLPKMGKEINKIFGLNDYPYAFTQEKINELLKDGRSIIVHCKY